MPPPLSPCQTSTITCISLICPVVSCFLPYILRSSVLSLFHYGRVPFLKPFLVGISPGTPGFGQRPVHVGFIVIKVALGNVSLISPVNNIPPVPPAHSPIHSDAVQSDNLQRH